MIFHAPPLHSLDECRAEINRRNAERSTGPRTTEGKTRSSQNAFKHGLYSKQLIRPGEDPAEFDELRTTLRREHQPASTTEEILVDELTHHFWRLRRFREMEARAWYPDAVNQSIDNGLLTLLTRTIASAERGFFRALAALAKLQKARGFVPQTQPAHDPATQPREAAEDEPVKKDSVPADASCYLPTHDEIDWLPSANSTGQPQHTTSRRRKLA